MPPAFSEHCVLKQLRSAAAKAKAKAAASKAKAKAAKAKSKGKAGRGHAQSSGQAVAQTVMEYGPSLGTEAKSFPAFKDVTDWSRPFVVHIAEGSALICDDSIKRPGGQLQTNQ